MIISKSNYLTFLKHPAWFWLEKHQPEMLPKHDDNTIALFAAGHTFESYAEQLFPHGHTLGYTSNGQFDYSLYASLPDRTMEAVHGEHSVLFQGRVEVDGLTCIFDVLERTAMVTFNLYEIKSSSSVRRDHEYDLAFQTYVLEKAGLSIDKISVIHVNSEYVRKGDIDPHQIADETEVTNAVRVLLPETETTIAKARETLALPEMPDPSPRHCRNGSTSEWLPIYESITDNLPPYTIYQLSGIGVRKITPLEDAGITLITDIPDDFPLTSKQQVQVAVTKTNTPYIDTEKITDFIAALKFPLYFLDYETFSNVIPPYDGLRPYQQIPFQYSLHIKATPEAPLEHREYLHTTSDMPLPSLLAQLSQDIGTEGTVLVWYETFEKGRNVEMAHLVPEYNEFLYQLNDRVVDLMTPFAKGWYADKDFYGKSSIKNVLPVLVPELSYKALAIQNGSTAQRVWSELVQQGLHQENRDEIETELRKYCELDTLAMVKIFEVLTQIK